MNASGLNAQPDAYVRVRTYALTSLTKSLSCGPLMSHVSRHLSIDHPSLLEEEENDRYIRLRSVGGINIPNEGHAHLARRPLVMVTPLLVLLVFPRHNERSLIIILVSLFWDIKRCAAPEWLW